MACCFRITGSLIKPNRETLLDYLSYLLIIVALIGVARVFFGGHDLTKGCNLDLAIATNGHSVLSTINLTAAPVSENASTFNTTHSNLSLLLHKNKYPRSVKVHDKNETGSNSQESGDYEFDSDVESDDVENISISESSTSPHTNAPKTTTSNISHFVMTLNGEDVVNMKHIHHSVSINECPKYYQAYFPFILLVEGIIMLLSGILWVKLPRVNAMVSKFYDLVQECRKLNWNKRDLLQSTKSPDISSTSVHDTFIYDQEYIISGEYINILLNKLFNSENSYASKSHARQLYEKVQILCIINNERTDLWNVYLIKTTVQLVIWFSCLTLNMVLFVVFQFYMICNEEEVACNHDTYLRIIWYMGELMVIAYAVFNCKTLIWINKISDINRQHHRSTMISLCATCFGCNYTNDEDVKTELMTCKPFCVDSEQVLTNDMALLLHLMRESWPRWLSYFVIFTYEEWKTKLQSFSTRLKQNGDLDNVFENAKQSNEVTDPKSPVTSDARSSEQSIRFFFHSDEDEPSPPTTSSSNELQYKSETKLNPRTLRKNTKSFIHEIRKHEKPKMTKFHSIAVPHGSSMYEIAEADKVFVGGCIRPVPSSIRLQAMKMQKPLLRQQGSKYIEEEELNVDEKDSLLASYR